MNKNIKKVNRPQGKIVDNLRKANGIVSTKI